MADTIKMITDDHRKVERLFQEFQQSQSQDIALQICTELQVHVALEEELLYPILQEIDEELAQEAQKEHDEAKGIVQKVERAAGSDGALADLMTQLEQAVQHHVEEEEQQVLPRLQEEAGPQVEALAPEMTERKQQMLKQMGESGGTVDLSKEELYEKAKEAGIEGRSKMNKEELAQAVEQQ